MPILRTVEGLYREGKIELETVPYGVRDATRVLVTFLEPNAISLHERGIDGAQAADLRAQLATFVEDWDRPEMDVYNDYEHAQRDL